MTDARLLAHARDMLQVLDLQLDTLARKRDRLRREAEGESTRNQQYWYVADANGLIRFDRDSAFVAESMLVCNATASVISITDVGSAQEVTKSNYPDPPGAATPARVIDSFVIPTQALVDLRGLWAVPPANARNASNVDNWHGSPVDFLVPRGSVLRVTFTAEDLALFGDAVTAYPLLRHYFILSGYKVF